VAEQPGRQDIAPAAVRAPRGRRGLSKVGQRHARALAARNSAFVAPLLRRGQFDGPSSAFKWPHRLLPSQAIPTVWPHLITNALLARHASMARAVQQRDLTYSVGNRSLLYMQVLRALRRKRWVPERLDHSTVSDALATAGDEQAAHLAEPYDLDVMGSALIHDAKLTTLMMKYMSGVSPDRPLARDWQRSPLVETLIHRHNWASQSEQSGLLSRSPLKTYLDWRDHADESEQGKDERTFPQPSFTILPDVFHLVHSLQRKAAASGAGPSTGRLATAVDIVARSAGAPIVSPVRRAFERLLGSNLAEVRVHTGDAAGAAAAAVSAQAFTLGRDIYFAPGMYVPSTVAGFALLGHELVHTLQQQRMPMPQRKAVPYALPSDESMAEAPELEEEALRVESNLGRAFTAGNIGPLLAPIKVPDHVMLPSPDRATPSTLFASGMSVLFQDSPTWNAASPGTGALHHDQSSRYNRAISTDKTYPLARSLRRNADSPSIALAQYHSLTRDAAHRPTSMVRAFAPIHGAAGYPANWMPPPSSWGLVSGPMDGSKQVVQSNIARAFQEQDSGSFPKYGHLGIDDATPRASIGIYADDATPRASIGYSQGVTRRPTIGLVTDDAAQRPNMGLYSDGAAQRASIGSSQDAVRRPTISLYSVDAARRAGILLHMDDATHRASIGSSQDAVRRPTISLYSVDAARRPGIGYSQDAAQRAGILLYEDDATRRASIGYRQDAAQRPNISLYSDDAAQRAGILLHKDDATRQASIGYRHDAVRRAGIGLYNDDAARRAGISHASSDTTQQMHIGGSDAPDWGEHSSSMPSANLDHTRAMTTVFARALAGDLGPDDRPLTHVHNYAHVLPQANERGRSDYGAASEREFASNGLPVSRWDRAGMNSGLIPADSIDAGDSRPINMLLAGFPHTLRMGHPEQLARWGDQQRNSITPAIVDRMSDHVSAHLKKQAHESSDGAGNEWSIEQAIRRSDRTIPVVNHELAIGLGARSAPLHDASSLASQLISRSVETSEGQSMGTAGLDSREHVSMTQRASLPFEPGIATPEYRSSMRSLRGESALTDASVVPGLPGERSTQFTVPRGAAEGQHQPTGEDVSHSGSAGTQDGVAVDAVVDKVIVQLKRQLMLDHERAGGFPSELTY
jgi:Domain of unknown function (DUF4157)